MLRFSFGLGSQRSLGKSETFQVTGFGFCPPLVLTAVLPWITVVNCARMKMIKDCDEWAWNVSTEECHLVKGSIRSVSTMTKGPKIKWIYYDEEDKVTLWEHIGFNSKHVSVQTPTNIAKKVIGPAFEENGIKLGQIWFQGATSRDRIAAG